MRQLRLLTIGNKPPTWIDTAFEDYSKRLSTAFKVELLEFPVEKNRLNTQTAIQKESAKLLAAHKSQHQLVVLDLKGKMWSTEDLAKKMKDWQKEGVNVDLMIGGPDGLSGECREAANEIWSLSALTLPHMLVRIIVIEQMYRAWSILQGHPYHK